MGLYIIVFWKFVRVLKARNNKEQHCLELQRGQENGKKKETKSTLIIKYMRDRMGRATIEDIACNTKL